MERERWNYRSMVREMTWRSESGRRYDLKIEEETGLWDKVCRQPLKVEKVKEMDSPLGLPERNSPATILLFAQWHLCQTSDLQNCMSLTLFLHTPYSMFLFIHWLILSLLTSFLSFVPSLPYFSVLNPFLCLPPFSHFHLSSIWSSFLCFSLLIALFTTVKSLS